MYRKIYLIIIFLSLTILYGADFSIKFEKNFEIKAEGEDYLIARLAAADIDENGNIYIVDYMGNSILKFNKNGKFLRRYGRKGEGPGDFPRKPFSVEYSEGKIYIGLHFNAIYGIFVFNTDLKFINKINYNKKVLSFYVRDKHIYISNRYINNAFTFDVLGKQGNYLHNQNFNPHKLEPIYENYKHMVIDKKGDMYILSAFEDKIEKWNSKNVKIWSKYLFSGQKIKYSKGAYGKIPENTYWYNKIAIDNTGRIYIMGANIAKHYKRDFYVISETGKLLTIFTIPHMAHQVFRIDKDNNMYVDDLRNENRALIRYKLNFDSKRINLEAKGYPPIKKCGMLFEYINAQK